MRVCPEACSLFWAALSLACFWYSRCRLEQAWHRVSSGMGGAPHSIQMPRSLALSLLSWVLRRINSLRSGVWARWRSYSRRFSCLASSSARVGSTRGFGVLGWGVAFRDVFTAGLFQLWGRPPLLAGFGREKVNSKVWPIAHSCGLAGLCQEIQMARVPDPDFFPIGIPEFPDELSDPDSPVDLEGDWDPVGLAMLARLFTRSYLQAQAESEVAPDE